MILKTISEKRFGRKRHREVKVRILTPRTTGKFANHGYHAALLPLVHSELASSRESPTLKPPKMCVSPARPAATATASPSKNSANIDIITEDADSPKAIRCPSPTSAAQLPDPSIRIEYEEPLIIVPNKENQIQDTTETAANEHEPKRRDRVVSFQDHVTVLEIPSHRDYSPAEHKNIWSTASERKESRRRNVREFQADQRDWRRCKEDHEMVYLDGEMVHPHTYLQVTGKQARSTNHVSNPKLKRREYVAVKAKNAATFNKAKLGATKRKTLTTATRRRGATQGGQQPLQQCHKRILPMRKGLQ